MCNTCKMNYKAKFARSIFLKSHAFSLLVLLKTCTYYYVLCVKNKYEQSRKWTVKQRPVNRRTVPLETFHPNFEKKKITILFLTEIPTNLILHKLSLRMGG